MTKPEATMGRGGTDIVVNVSSTYCAIEVRGNHAVLADLGSIYGTFVGEEQIKSCRIEHLTEFRFGVTTMMFAITDVDA